MGQLCGRGKPDICFVFVSSRGCGARGMRLAARSWGIAPVLALSPASACCLLPPGCTPSKPAPLLPGLAGRRRDNLPAMLGALRAHLASCTVLAGVVAPGVLGRDTGALLPLLLLLLRPHCAALLPLRLPCRQAVHSTGATQHWS